MARPRGSSPTHCAHPDHDHAAGAGLHTPASARQTHQRDAIMAVINAAPGPLTVPELHQQAAAHLPRLGIATVYRTVKLLLETQQIHAVILPDGQTRYESACLGHHDHFRCRQCEGVFDLPQCPMPLPRGQVLPGGFVVERHEVTLYGLCPNCSGKTPPGRSASKRQAGGKRKRQ